MAEQPLAIAAPKADRLAWIDYARGIAIILVLYRHVYVGLQTAGLAPASYPFLRDANTIFFSFRMPLFFIVSGLFVGSSLLKRGFADYFKTKAKTILYPYVLWATIQITLQLILTPYVNSNRTLHDYLYILYNPRELEQFWYLYALFNVSVAYALVKAKTGFNIWQQIGLGLLLYFLSTWPPLQGRLYFIYDLFHYYLFFAFGDAVSQFIRNRENFRLFQSWKLFLILLPVFAVSQYYFLIESNHYNSDTYLEDHFPVLFLIISLCGCAFLMNVSFILQRYQTAKPLRVIGFHSLYIYATHVMVVAACRIVCTKFLGITNVYFLLLLGITVGLLIPLYFYKFTQRMGAWWLFTLEKPKRA